LSAPLSVMLLRSFSSPRGVAGSAPAAAARAALVFGSLLVLSLVLGGTAGVFLRRVFALDHGVRRVDRRARKARDAADAHSRLDREALSRREAAGGTQSDAAGAHTQLIPRPPQNVIVEAALARRPEPGIAEVSPIERLSHEMGG